MFITFYTKEKTRLECGFFFLSCSCLLLIGTMQTRSIRMSHFLLSLHILHSTTTTITCNVTNNIIPYQHLLENEYLNTVKELRILDNIVNAFNS